MEQQQKEGKTKEPIGVVGRLFTDNPTARILDHFISHRFQPYSVDQVGKALELSNAIVSEAIDQLEKREIVRQDKRGENTANETTYTLFVESMTANTIIRAAFEMAKTERISEKPDRE
jgi:predicted ArsR family transcriptional regulator